MEIKYDLKENGTYLEITLHGDFSMNSIALLMQNVLKECTHLEKSKVLVDCRNMKMSDLSVLNRYIIGEDISKVFGHKYYFATVNHSHLVTPVMGLVAGNRSGNLKAF